MRAAARRAPIDVAAELRRLDSSIAREIAAWPPGLRLISRTMMDRMGLRRGGPGRWSERFSPLVALYPTLQSAGVPDVAAAPARRAALAHMFLLTHAFIEDRLLDGESSDAFDASILSKQFLLEGLRIADELSARVGGAALLAVRAARAQGEAQLSLRRKKPSPRGSRSPSVASAERAAAARAAFGFLAAEILLRNSGPGAAALPRARKVYAHLVIGLQWADDLDDWRDDIAAGRENLLLVRGDASGPAGGVFRSGALPRALRAARSHFAAAARLARASGCPALALLIDEKREALGRSEARLVDALAAGFLRAMEKQTGAGD